MKTFFPLLILLTLLPGITKAQAPGCPSLEAGPAPVFNTGDTTICGPANLTLTANVFHMGYTNTYTVSSIPYAPPYPFTSGTVFSLGVDDIWSSAPITLPFNFCFFGNMYTQVWVGSNGVLTFTNPNSTYCPWSFTASVPSSSLISNAVFGVYQDIDPSVCGTIRYGVLGSYPCRTFVFNFYQVCHFSCTTIMTTSQMVLYEGTNAIEVYVQNKPLCSSWNSGNAIIGIQNAGGTIGFTPPGRNTSQWTATNEAWRFTPNGAPAYTISWFNNSTLVGYNAQQNVFVAQPDTFIAIASYDFCDGTQLTFRDTVHVYMSPQDVTIQTPDSVLCLGESTTLTALGGDSYTWNTGATSNSINISPPTSGFYSVTGTYQSTCAAEDSIYITVNPLPPVSVSATPPDICSEDSSVLEATGAPYYTWATLPDTVGIVQVSPVATTTYSVTGTDANGCTGSGSVQLVVNETPIVTITASPPDGCEDLTVNFNAASNPAASLYQWTFSDGTTSTDPNPVKIFGTPGKYDVELDVISVDGCSGSVDEIGLVNVYPLPVSNFIVDSNSVSMDNPVVNFTDLSTLPYTYYWDFGDYSSATNYSNLSNPSHSYSGPGDYIVWQTVYTEYGCMDSSYTVIHVYLNIAFYVPNAFSPYNDDGLNDVFKPEGIGIALGEGTYIMRIFDRVGQLIFESKNIDLGWDGTFKGKDVPPGVYSYSIEVMYGDGLWHKYFGKITLIN